MSFVLLLAGLAFTTFPLASTLTLNCAFNHHTYGVAGEIYRCVVSNSIISERPDDTVDGITGSHKSDYDNDDLTGIRIDSKVCKFFPKGLDKFFKKMKLIHLQNSGLQELHKSDLEPFTELEEIDLDQNKLKVIEADVFAGNLNLKYISISNNEIEEIEPKTFSSLMKLSSLYLHGNKCGRSLNGVFNNRRELEAVVRNIEQDGCLSSERSKMFIEKSHNCSKALGEAKTKNAELEKLADLYEESQRNVTAMEVKINTITQHYENVVDVNGTKTIDTVLSNAECNATVSKLSDEKTQLNEKITKLKDEVSDKSEVIEDRLKEISNMNITINDYEAKVKGLKEDIQNMKYKFDEAEGDANECGQREIKLNSKKRELEGKVSSLEGEIAAKNSNLETKTKAMVELQNKLRECQSNSTLLDSRNFASQEALNSSKSHVTYSSIVIGLLCLGIVVLSVLYYRERKRVSSFYERRDVINGVNGGRTDFQNHHLMEDDGY